MRMKWLDDYKCWVFDDGRIATPTKDGIRFVKLQRVKEYAYAYLPAIKGMRGVHRLLALAFIPNPENKPCIDHIDRDRTNNSLDNLRWVSYAENAENQDRVDQSIEKYGVRESGDRHAYNSSYAKVNREKLTEKHRKWAAANREHCNAYARERRARRRVA